MSPARSRGRKGGIPFRRALLRCSVSLAGLTVLSAVVGVAAEAGLSRRDRDMYPPPGRLVDIGGRRMHLQCAGSGSPTVIMEMGAGAWSVFWTRIYEAISKVTRACLYDRAGYGWSDPGPLPRSAEALVGDLHTLLDRSGEQSPFLLAGHSLGGWIVRLYQARYPADVVGLALVESAHPRQWSELPPEVWQLVRSSVGSLRLLGFLGRFGVLRLMTDQLATQRLPDAVMGAYRATARRPSAFRAFASEVDNSVDFAAAVDTFPGLGDLPLLIISAGHSFDAFREVTTKIPFEAANAVWMQLQSDFDTLSTRSMHLTSSRSTHNIHVDDPDLVVHGLSALVDTIRSNLGIRSEILAANSMHALPDTSDPELDKLLAGIEAVYAAMDTEGFVEMFTDDFEQLDVPRRVHIVGRQAWRDQTKRINSLHTRMGRIHHGRARIGDWAVVEMEWFGTVRGDKLGASRGDRTYRYTGLGLLKLEGRRISRQILYGDVPTLMEQLDGGSPPANPSSTHSLK